ncbi:hypothetical protein GLOIN_2v833580 [Rhizophagus irregularis DAOM 181602=DAOM 197198]|nr:hypothetical protein GLOIN_2v833580 [Rhizophagus irregularis DAOM 181602=DAOM 197198]
MPFFDQSEEWSLLNFLKYLDSVKSLDDRSEAHHKKKAKQALLTYESTNESHSSEIREFWLRISLNEKATKSTKRIIDQINIVQDEASDILVLCKRDNLMRLRSDFEIGENTEEDGGLAKNKPVRPSNEDPSNLSNGDDFSKDDDLFDDDLFDGNDLSNDGDISDNNNDGFSNGFKSEKASNKRENETERDVSTCKKAKKSVKNDSQPRNGRSSTEPLLSSDESNKEHNEDDTEIKVDLPSISTELQREPIVKWEVGHINVTDRFRQYQKEIINKAEMKGLKYDNIYELLALSSIIDAFMESGKSKLSRLAARSFNDLYDSIMKTAPLKLKRPDLSCVVNGVPILNSEFKPLGNTPLQRMKDRLKAQLRARKSINQQLQNKGGPGEAVIFLNMGDLMESYSMDLKYDGLYRSWPFLTTRLVVDKTMIPLAGVAIHHLVSLEEHVERIAKDYKYRACRSGNTTPIEQMSFMRKFPDSPQVKKLIH